MLAGLVSDYTKYKDVRNVTFVGICTSTTGTVKSMTDQVNKFGLKPFANMLDAGGMTAAAYGVPRNAKFWLILLDCEGKIAYSSGGMGWHWTSGPDAGKTVFETQLEASYAKSNGLLFNAKIPKTMKYAAHLFDLQQFDLMDAEVKKSMTAGSTEEDEFASLLRAQVAAERRKRLEQIQALARTDPVQGYRDAIAFVEAFPKAPEMNALRTIGQKLSSDPKVQRELQAEAGYQQVMVPVMKRTITPALFDKNMGPLLDGYLKSFGDTKYAEIVKGAVESLKVAVNTKH